MSSRKRSITQNTLFLYSRMILVMGVTFYTSRVVLSSLGEVDYGINNVIGGLALMFGFFSSSLTNATQRFLNVAQEKNSLQEIQAIFSASQVLFFLLSVAIFVTAEIVGLWFIYNKLVIPPHRLDAALWVFHATLISLLFSINGIVFNSVLVANENFKIYSYLGILEAFLRLGIAFIISQASSTDRLKLYSILYVTSIILVQIFYAIYCYCKYPECVFKGRLWNLALFRSLLTFIGWNGVSTLAGTVSGSGINLLLNIFFGNTINAARGLSAQLEYALNNVNTGFITAIKPQMIKLYSSSSLRDLPGLLVRATKGSFYLMLLLGTPLIIFREEFLKIWLVNPPLFTDKFLTWGVIFILVDCLRYPVWLLIQAIGYLKVYVLMESVCLLAAVILGYIGLQIYNDPTIPIIALTIMRGIALISNVWSVKCHYEAILSIYKRQIVPFLLLVSASFYLYVIVWRSILPPIGSLITLFILVGLSLFGAVILLYTIGTTSSERELLNTKIKKSLLRA